MVIPVADSVLLLVRRKFFKKYRQHGTFSASHSSCITEPKNYARRTALVGAWAFCYIFSFENAYHYI